MELSPICFYRIQARTSFQFLGLTSKKRRLQNSQKPFSRACFPSAIFLLFISFLRKNLEPKIKINKIKNGMSLKCVWRNSNFCRKVLTGWSMNKHQFFLLFVFFFMFIRFLSVKGRFRKNFRKFVEWPVMPYILRAQVFPIRLFYRGKEFF